MRLPKRHLNIVCIRSIFPKVYGQRKDRSMSRVSALFPLTLLMPTLNKPCIARRPR